MAQHMALDRYGRTTIRNIYFDTDDYRLIRRSFEKPAYKEKLRVRSYSQAISATYVGGSIYSILQCFALKTASC